MLPPKIEPAKRKSLHQGGGDEHDAPSRPAKRHTTTAAISTFSPESRLQTEPPMSNIADSTTAMNEGQPTAMVDTSSTGGANKLDDQAEEEKETAAQKVFRMSEVVEVILDKLTAPELFNAVRINRTLLDTVATVPRFHQKMFLTADKIDSKAEWDVKARGTPPALIQINPLVCRGASCLCSDDGYNMSLERYVGLDDLREQCSFVFGKGSPLNMDMAGFSLQVVVESKERLLSLGVGLPGPVTRTYLSQPAFRTALILLWPSPALTAAVRSRRSQANLAASIVTVCVHVMPASLGELLAVVRGIAAHEPSAKDWMRGFSDGSGNGGRIVVDKTVYPGVMQNLLCGNPTYKHFCNRLR